MVGACLGLVAAVVGGVLVGARTTEAQPTPFTEEAASRGLVIEGGPLGSFGAGLAFADLDGDADPDVVAVSTSQGRIVVFENNGFGSFTQRSPGSDAALVRGASGVTAADYDADGDLDLYVSVWLDADVFLRNDGGFAFTDVTAQAGLGDRGAGAGCAWADYDDDGWLDLYVANRTGTDIPGGGTSPEPNRLYHNLGNGTFEEVAQTLGVDDQDSFTFQAAFFDYDRDGDQDIYIANDKGTTCFWTNELYENVGGSFVTVSAPSGADVCVNGMCVAIGDFDANLYQDIYVSNSPEGNPLLLNQGDGTFVESGAEVGVASYWTAWGSVFFDHDNDGLMDLYVCNMGAPNRLYRSQGAWPVVDVAAQMGVDDPGASFCVAVADIDADGDLDLLMGSVGQPAHLYVNREGQKRNWARFRIAGIGANRFGVGARVDLTAGGSTQTRQLMAGGAYKTQNDLALHFGLGDATMIDRIDVTWPGGSVQRTLSGYHARKTWTLYPPDQLGDADRDGDVDADDLTALIRCMTGSGVGLVGPGCEMLDMDGDGDVDQMDLALLLRRLVGVGPTGSKRLRPLP